MDLERRVEKLERENRRLKRIGGFVVALLTVVSLAGAVVAQDPQEESQEPPDEIEAKLFRVVDDDGNALAELSAYGTGSRLVLVDASGKWRVVLGALENGPQIALHDHENDDVLWRARR